MPRPFRSMFIALTVAATVAASGVAALAAPVPGGTARDASTAVLHLQAAAGCGGGSVSIKVVKTYDSNGRLKTVLATATSKVTCSPGLADFMYNTASVEKNGAVAKTGKTSSCDNPPNCTLTYSSIMWLCTARPGVSHRSYVFCEAITGPKLTTSSS